MAIAQKILCAGYLWPSIFKECHEDVKKLPLYQHFYLKRHTHPSPLHHAIAVGPFSKWGIDFMHYKPASVRGHGYINVAVDYFTKWVEAMPTYVDDKKTTALFLFNHIITRFRVPRAIVTDHSSHFQNNMMSELSAKIGFFHDNYTPYYPQVNG